MPIYEIANRRVRQKSNLTFLDCVGRFVGPGLRSFWSSRRYDFLKIQRLLN